MTTSSAHSALPRTPLVEALGLAVCVGIAAAAIFGAYDALHHVVNGPPADVIAATAFAVLIAAPGMLAIGLATFVGLAALGRVPDRAHWAALIFTVGGMILLALLVFAGSIHYRNMTGLVLLAAATPVSITAYHGLTRFSLLARRGRAIVFSLAAALAVFVAAGGLAVIRWLALPGALKLLAPLLALTAFGAAIRLARYRPRACAAGLLVGLGAVGAALDSMGSPHGPALPLRAGGRVPGARPNVVLIVLDTTRRDAIGCYGNSAGVTPELDRLAGQGVLYENAVSPSCWTTPSHASLFTGLYPLSHGCSYEHHLWLDDDIPTLASVLRGQGYKTAAFVSNFRLVISNVLHGFDARVRLDRRYIDLVLRDLAATFGAPRRWVDKGGSLAAAELRDWLSQRRDLRAPVFVFFNLFEAHAPYLPPREQRNAGWPAGVSAFEAARISEMVLVNWVRMHVGGFRDDRIERTVAALYQLEIRYQDRCLREILRTLGESLDMDNTLVIVTADHGENLGAAGRWGHVHAMNGDLLNVPLVIRGPGFTGGTRVAGPCQTVDILPTVLDVVGASKLLPSLPGRTLRPSRFVPRKELFAQDDPFYPDMQTIETTLG